VTRADRTAVVTDPYLVTPVHDRADYRPLPARLVGALDAVLLTHSHPDHFDPGSLLRLARDTPVVVPVIERESILAVDLVRRLTELGCTDVRPMEWWSTTTIGPITITALPFYGEQPGDGPVLHPDVRNAGNTYVVDRSDGRGAAESGEIGRVVFLADSGRDHLGDVRDVAGRVGAEAPVDLVFSGYRAWNAHPAELLLSSVAHFLYFVPPDQWTVRQQLMNGPAEAVQAAAAFGGRWLVPYADGGAPWYWDRGLGPVLDGTGEERPGFDPFPERVVDAARGSRVDVVLLRPGDSLVVDEGAPAPRRRPGYAWPFAG
jgi:L-ascorbate metabolism protein UlaG (beta-lactamase superfamily)